MSFGKQLYSVRLIYWGILNRSYKRQSIEKNKCHDSVSELLPEKLLFCYMIIGFHHSLSVPHISFAV